ncbi:restriction endonuclease subunit S [Staphylococcus hominis]|uniref:restriction endonuclease subunit S n=1 Tax=Staphylococcus hominis TaxID=1290 RepID=UPI003DA147AD
MLTKKMKDSGIEWVGEIPEDWLLVKYKRFAKSGMGVTLLKSDLLDRETADSIPVYSATQENEFFGYTENKKLLLECGDLVIPARGNSIGHIKVVDKTATSTQTTIYSKVFSNEINIMFLKYCSDGLKDNWFKFDDTAIPQITVNQVNNNPVPYPSLKEQEKIVKILNKITQKVDNILKQTQQSIKELKKYKQSLITEAVTKGLDPNVEMKDSGVEWIGAIPSRWGLNQIKTVAKVMNGKKIETDDGHIPVFGSGGVFKYTNTKLYDRESVLFGRKGTIGKPLIVNQPFWTVDTMFYTHIFENRAFPKWLYYILISLPWDVYSTQTTIPSIVGSEIESIRIPVPAIEEQQQIVQYLDNKISTIDKLIEDKTKVIEELENYKKSLIYEYVTGKKEV